MRPPTKAQQAHLGDRRYVLCFLDAVSAEAKTVHGVLNSMLAEGGTHGNARILPRESPTTRRVPSRRSEPAASLAECRAELASVTISHRHVNLFRAGDTNFARHLGSPAPASPASTTLSTVNQCKAPNGSARRMPPTCTPNHTAFTPVLGAHTYRTNAHQVAIRTTATPHRWRRFALQR
jgi:hypothetical protein